MKPASAAAEYQQGSGVHTQEYQLSQENILDMYGRRSCTYDIRTLELYICIYRNGCGNVRTDNARTQERF